jgi:hypothetical protein
MILKIRQTSEKKEATSARKVPGRFRCRRIFVQCTKFDWAEPAGNGETAPAGRKGPAATLERLESTENPRIADYKLRSIGGNPIEIQACQDFWLKCSETLRRLDLAVEVARRNEEVQIPLREAESIIFGSRFRGILDFTIRNSLKTRNPVPTWAPTRFLESWNVTVRALQQRIRHLKQLRLQARPGP